jgi:hypothetical protein
VILFSVIEKRVVTRFKLDPEISPFIQNNLLVFFSNQTLIVYDSNTEATQTFSTEGCITNGVFLNKYVCLVKDSDLMIVDIEDSLKVYTFPDCASENQYFSENSQYLILTTSLFIRIYEFSSQVLLYQKRFCNSKYKFCIILDDQYFLLYTKQMKFILLRIENNTNKEIKFQLKEQSFGKIQAKISRNSKNFCIIGGDSFSIFDIQGRLMITLRNCCSFLCFNSDYLVYELEKKKIKKINLDTLEGFDLFDFKTSNHEIQTSEKFDELFIYERDEKSFYGRLV